MKISAPSKLCVLISVGIAVVALLLFLEVFSLGVEAFWVGTAAYVVLLLGCLMKGF